MLRFDEFALHRLRHEPLGHAGGGHEGASAARRRGLPVDCDAYPYEAATNPLRNLLPSSVQEGGIGAMLERLGQAPVRERLRADGATVLLTAREHAQTVGLARRAFGEVRVVLTSRRGELHGYAHVTEALRPGALSSLSSSWPAQRPTSSPTPPTTRHPRSPSTRFAPSGSSAPDSPPLASTDLREVQHVDQETVRVDDHEVAHAEVLGAQRLGDLKAALHCGGVDGLDVIDLDGDDHALGGALKSLGRELGVAAHEAELDPRLRSLANL